MSVIDDLIDNPPKLHLWSGKWNTGGLSPELLRIVRDLTKELPQGFRAIETGAGLSTIFFAACGAEVVCIAPDAELKERVIAAYAERGLEVARLEFIVARSEEALPDLTRGARFHLALIDGVHGYPTPYVDFCYCNRSLLKNGLLIVDDVQLHSCAQLFLLLKSQPGWQLVRLVGKTAIFKKLTDAPYLPDFGGQPYVLGNSVTAPS